MNSSYEKPFTDVTVTSEPYPIVCYRTGLTVYEEALIDGTYISRGWNGAGFPLTVTNCDSAFPVHVGEFALPQAFRLGMDGQFMGSHWQWDGFEKSEEPKGLHVIVRLTHKVRKVEVAVHTLLDGTPVLTRWLEITNTGSSQSALHELSPMSGSLQTTKNWKNHLAKESNLYSLGYMDFARWGHEGGFGWHHLPNACFQVHGKFRRDRHRHPMYILKNKATGEHFICQFAWSGGYVFEFNLDNEGVNAQLDWKAGIDGPYPFRLLNENETIKSPEVHMGMILGDFDGTVQAMHDHLRKSVFFPQARGRGCWVEYGVGPEADMSEEYTLRSVEDAAFLGAEVFFIDAGWYVPPGLEGIEWWARVGDWKEDKDRYPKGLSIIREQVKKHGMLFGLWMEPERLGSSSDIIKEHPEWAAVNYGGSRSIASQLDLTNPEAAQWMEDTITRVIGENELDFFRLDYNVETRQMFSWSQKDGYVKDSHMCYYEVLEGIFMRLRRRFPDVIFENCSSGGGRTALSTVKSFSHTWVTDWQLAPRSFMITNGMTIALPPEYVDRVLAGQNGHLAGSLDFQTRLTMFVRPTIFAALYPLGHKPNPLQVAFIKHSIDIYKNFIRTFMPDGRIYHHTPDPAGPEPKCWGILEIASKDKTKGAVGVFHLADELSDETIVRFRGVDKAALYKVTFDNDNSYVYLEGIKLSQDGIRVRLEGPMTSELVLYEKFDR